MSGFVSLSRVGLVGHVWTHGLAFMSCEYRLSTYFSSFLSCRFFFFFFFFFFLNDGLTVKCDEMWQTSEQQQQQQQRESRQSLRERWKEKKRRGGTRIIILMTGSMIQPSRDSLSLSIYTYLNFVRPFRSPPPLSIVDCSSVFWV